MLGTPHETPAVFRVLDSGLHQTRREHRRRERTSDAFSAHQIPPKFRVHAVRSLVIEGLPAATGISSIKETPSFPPPLRTTGATTEACQVPRDLRSVPVFLTLSPVVWHLFSQGVCVIGTELFSSILVFIRSSFWVSIFMGRKHFCDETSSRDCLELN